jgi:hypothetical protein
LYVAILRDVLARFAVSVDDAPLSKLDKRINVVKDNIAKMASIAGAGFAAVAYGAYKAVSAASNADESLNVLRQTFKGNSDAVVQWSKTIGKEVGRSEYTLQEAAGRFGSFLSPVFKDSGVDITKMSERLAELAVDLGSFYNTSDEEAAMRLFSGMSGETEAVRRLGIDISDSSLKDLHKKSGDKRAYESLDLATKTQLRFTKILADTVDKQGDAARTAGGWANSVKRVQERIKTLTVEIGRRLMPTAKKFLNALEHTVLFVGKAYDFITRQTHSLEVAFGLATIALTRFAYAQAALVVTAPGFLAQLVAYTGAALKSAAAFAKLALTFLVIEDFIGFLRGHKSVFGDFLTEVTGLQKPLQAFEDVMADLASHFMNVMTAIKNMALFIPRVSAALMLGKPLGEAVSGASDMRQDMVDVDKHARQRDTDRRAAFQSAVEAGDYKGAMQHSDPLETKSEAKRRALQTRVDYVSANPDKATEQDYATGLASWSAAKPSMQMQPQNISPAARASRSTG